MVKFSSFHLSIPDCSPLDFSHMRALQRNRYVMYCIHCILQYNLYLNGVMDT